MSVLLLGHNGGLGTDLLKYLESSGKEVLVVKERWPSKLFKDCVLSFSNLDCVVNCIAQTTTGDFSVNYELPMWLDSLPLKVTRKVVYPGTDCLNENTPYALSKAKAVNFLSKKAIKTKVINCSFIS